MSERHGPRHGGCSPWHGRGDRDAPHEATRRGGIALAHQPARLARPSQAGPVRDRPSEGRAMVPSFERTDQ
jgi:hypothetical protein